MKQREGPFLELNFYCAIQSEQDLFLRVVTTLIDQGAQFTGLGYAHFGQGVRDLPFASVTDELAEPISVTSISMLQHYLSEPDMRVIEVRLVGGVLIDTVEIVTYQRLPSNVVSHDFHPVAIWTEGWWFDKIMSDADRDYASQAGKKTYERFCLLSNVLKPTYAAITTEYPLSCLKTLQSGPDALIFQNFYIDRSFLGESSIQTLHTLYADAYFENLEHGIYISCNKLLNPEYKEIEYRVAQNKSIEVSRVIANAGLQIKNQ